MRPPRIEPVDERDNNWEDSSLHFRVYLHGSGEHETCGWTDTYDVTGADVLQVIDWAQRQAGDSLTYAIALVRHDEMEERRNPGCGRGLIWILGMDGNDYPPTEPYEEDAQRRMLARRRQHVAISSEDRMPSGVPDPYNDGTRSRAL